VKASCEGGRLAKMIHLKLGIVIILLIGFSQAFQYNRAKDNSTITPDSFETGHKKGLITGAAVSFGMSMLSTMFLSAMPEGASAEGTVINDSPYVLSFDGCEVGDSDGVITKLPQSLRPGQSSTFQGFEEQLANDLWFKCEYKTKTKGGSKNVKIVFMVFLHIKALREKPNRLSVTICEEGNCAGKDSLTALFNGQGSQQELYDASLETGKYQPVCHCVPSLDVCVSGTMGSAQKTVVTLTVMDKDGWKY